ncbi:MAG: hypothetical protein Q8O67_22585 [Deltaproteobacteria bacterium]|nr:hypothetical protein [Deltaproteobacteria bacterium]
MQPVSPLSLGLQLDADGRERVHRGALVLLVTVVLSALVALCLAWTKGRDRSVDLDVSLVGFGLALLARIATIAGSTWLVAAPVFTTSTKGLVIGRRIRWGSAAFAMAFLVPNVVPPMSGLASGLHIAGGAIDACFWIVLALALRDLARAAGGRTMIVAPVSIVAIAHACPFLTTPIVTMLLSAPEHSRAEYDTVQPGAWVLYAAGHMFVIVLAAGIQLAIAVGLVSVLKRLKEPPA